MFKYFSIDEFDCQETGCNRMDNQFIHSLDELREACGFSFTITSGYRDPSHSIEAKKSKPGTHAQGIAAESMLIDTRTKPVLPAHIAKDMGDVIPGHSDRPHAGLDVLEGLLKRPIAAAILRRASAR